MMQVFNKACKCMVELDEFDIQTEQEHKSIVSAFPYQYGRSTGKRMKSSANNPTRRNRTRQLDLTKSLLKVGDIVFYLPGE